MIEALLPILGGAIGNIAGSGERAAAERASREAVQYLESVGIPSVEAQQIVMQNPEFISQFAPEGESAENLGPSQMEGIETDPRLKDAQMTALAQLQEQGQNPLTDTEKASLNQSRRDVAGEAQARQNSILQSMAERGAGGSGAELAAQLQSSQSSAQRQGEEADRLKMMAQQRALEAISQGGTLASGLRGQEFGEQAQVANAADAIAQFNSANRQNVQERNVAARNTAALREANLRQDMENQRVANANTQQQYNKQLLQQDYMNRLSKAQAMSQARTGQAQQHQQQAAQTANMWSQIGTGAGQAVTAFNKPPPETTDEEEQKKTSYKTGNYPTP